MQVPDGTIDPFRLTAANMLDAREHGAQILTGCEVTGLLRRGDRVCGVRYTTVSFTRPAPCTPGSGQCRRDLGAAHCGICRPAHHHVSGEGIAVDPDHRINNPVINRCRKPADADILVPGDTISLIGTTSMHIPYDEIDDNRVTTAEVETLLREGEKLAPVMGRTRILRAYSGVRPLVASDNDPSGRSVSRGIVLLDHAQRDGMEGFITITGGKLMTYRLMAEWATDAVCRGWATPPPFHGREPAARLTGADGKHPAKNYLPAGPLRALPSTAMAIALRPGLATAASTIVWSANAKPSPLVK